MKLVDYGEALGESLEEPFEDGVMSFDGDFTSDFVQVLETNFELLRA